jgi:hypothetical protein
MAGEAHEGVVVFQALSPGRASIKLGRIPVGEIGPVHDPRSLYPVCYRITLPFTTSAAWMPAHSMEDAERHVVAKINDWLNAAGLVPAGGV